VVAPQFSVKLEPVSPGLKGELIHPNRSATLYGLRFSKDGKRLLVGDYPGGVVVTWDVATGKRLTTLETGYEDRSTPDYFFISPDWQRLFGWRDKTKVEGVEQDGKRMVRWTFDSEVRVWDLASGKVVRTYKHQPPRSIRFMRLSPDGTAFFTSGLLPGIYERGAKWAVSLWDVKTGQSRTLPDGLGGDGAFSPDGRTLAFTAVGEDGYTRALKLFDTATGHEKLSIPVGNKNASARVEGFSPDGRLMLGSLQVFEPARELSWRPGLKVWDIATGREAVSVAGEPKDFLVACWSPDGRMLAALNERGEKKRVLLYSVPEKRLVGTVPVGEEVKGWRLFSRGLVFSPDGQWLVAITQAEPENGAGGIDARDMPQPRVVLIETASGKIRDTLVAPQGIPESTCFSPDGRTVAVGGYGRVLLWDLTKVQAPAEQTRRP
jgi:WD40 repeat protein